MSFKIGAKKPENELVVSSWRTYLGMARIISCFVSINRKTRKETMAKKALTFVLNDETKVNSYGFRVLNAGINLDRFEANPVMLSNHWNSTENVIGRWENVRIDGALLKADAVFDENDEDAKRIASKVEGGFIKGCSMGIRFSHEFVEHLPDDTYILNQSELYEVSIVAVPSNANAVKLYSQLGEIIDDDKVSLSLQNLMQQNTDKSNKTMSKLTLNAKAIAVLALAGITAPDSEEGMSTAFAEMGAQLQAEKTAHQLEKGKREELEQKIKAQETAQLTALVDQAVIDGQIQAAQKQTFIDLGFEQAKKLIEGLPKKVSLAAKVTNTDPSASAEVKTAEDFFKLSTDKQLAFKNENPEAYQALFK